MKRRMVKAMFEPISPSHWNPAMAAHLLNRAGFGATPTTIESFSSVPPEEAVRRLVYYDPKGSDTPPPDWAALPEASERFQRKSLRHLPPPARQARIQENRLMEQERMLALQHWWLNRMRHTPNPLEEKLTLFWHGHFTSSFDKVDESYALYLQNQTMRRLACAPLPELTTAMAKDPAMLLYLDNAFSRKQQPNENFARELMELFLLGEGNYTEPDIREAARAFTGWSVRPDRMEFFNNREDHDEENKTFMGLTGRLDGADIIGKLFEHPACPVWFATKLWRFFVQEEVDPALAQTLGDALRTMQFRMQPFLEMLFMSRAFYQRATAWAQIKSPVQWLVGSAIALDGPLPDAVACNQIMRTLGQELFAPPSVKGWEGGAAWITASTLMQRYNLAGYLVKGAAGMTAPRSRTSARRQRNVPAMPAETTGETPGGLATMPPIALLDNVIPAEKRRTLDAAYDYIEWRLYQRRLSEKERFAVRVYLTQRPMPALWTEDDMRQFLHLMMSTPYYQVC